MSDQGMQIKLDPAYAKEAVKLAIFQQLGEDGRQALISAALDYLLREPDKRGYGYDQQPSPLQQAFNNAASIAVNEIVREEVAKDPAFVAKVREKVGEAIAMVDEANFSTYVGDALGKALVGTGVPR